ncbi:hypothetical protein GQF03_08545 [Sneathiella chungangensis]|uniref:Uncharacterized protein n=1 Tax=Sneathiella chungangensis TaxID=1418234 RepID=A0A845MEI0_9PROT|nr:hypothetical protein [Sneathiella chungangensis]MZR22378.1 hypothetical protein [Sneathiella chungangensis]
MMTTDDREENFLPLSRSPIWELQRSYYENLGIDAWQPNMVPNYVTTNPFIARAYGKVIEGFLEDFAAGARAKGSDEPHYILELGAGSGRFAYSFLRHFFSPEATELRRKRNIVYVMTDISRANIGFWERHPQLRPFVDAGVLDFAHLDVVKEHPIRLLISDRIITPGSLATPLSVIANYVIDSIPHDLYSVRDGVLMARKVCHRIDTAGDNIDDIVRNTEFDYVEEPTGADIYENADWNRIVESYRQVKGGINFSLPVGGLTAIDRLSALTSGPMFWLAGDFGAMDLSVLKEMGPRKVARNGTYSLHVNFHAMAAYVTHRKGRVFTPGHAKSSLEMAGFLMNPGRKKVLHLAHRFKAHIRDNGPDEYFMLKKIAEVNFSGHSLGHILALLRMGHGDIKMFRGCLDALTDALRGAGAFEKKSVAEELVKVDEAHFRCDRTTDPALVILPILMHLEAMKEAQLVLERNRATLEATPEGTTIMSEVLIKAGRRHEAAAILNRLIQREPGYPPAQALLERLKTGERAAKSA